MEEDKNKKSETRIRNKVIHVRVSSEEEERLNAKSVTAGLSVGSLIRQFIMDGPTPRQVRRPPLERLLLAEVLGSLGRIGGNVNQVARLGNSGAVIDPNIMIEAVKELSDIRKAIHKAMGRDV